MTSTCPICGNDIDIKDGELVACASCLADGALEGTPDLEGYPDETGPMERAGIPTNSDQSDAEPQCSPRSEQGALRLFTTGFLPRLHSMDGVQGHSWTIPSETQEETEYVLRYDPQSSHKVSCTCPGWTYRNYCKHVRFLEFALGLVTSKAAFSRQEKPNRARHGHRAGRPGVARSELTAA